MTVDEQRIVNRLNAAIKPLQFKIMYNCKDPFESCMFVSIGTSNKNGHDNEWIYWRYGSWDSINKMFFGATSIFVLMCDNLDAVYDSMDIDRYHRLASILNAIRGECIEEMLLKMDLMGI